MADDRRRALEESGWGEEFRLAQPHNLAFWVYCLLVLVGAVVLLGQVSIAAAAYSGALLSGVLAFGLLAAAYVTFLRRQDRFTSLPPDLLAAGFVWGFVAATGAFAMYANDALGSLYAKLLGASFAFDWGAALTAPVHEELAKGAGVLLLLVLAPKLIRTPFDGLILGAFVGTGFMISEDISYAWIGAADAFGDVDAAWTTIVVRAITSITSHWVFTGIFGAGLIWFLGRPRVPPRKGLGLALMFTAVLGHGLWNASSAIGGDSAFGWIVPMGAAVTLISVIRWIYTATVPAERAWMRELMAPEVALGVVAPAELDALAGSREDLERYLSVQRDRRTAEGVLEAEHELAHQIARDGGAETGAVERARAAVAEARAP